MNRESLHTTFLIGAVFLGISTFLFIFQIDSPPMVHRLKVPSNQDVSEMNIPTPKPINPTKTPNLEANEFISHLNQVFSTFPTQAEAAAEAVPVHGRATVGQDAAYQLGLLADRIESRPTDLPYVLPFLQRCALDRIIEFSTRALCLKNHQDFSAWARLSTEFPWEQVEPRLRQIVERLPEVTYHFKKH